MFEDCGRSIFRIPWDCCIPRSPITPGLKSIPASTRSWVSLHMANLARAVIRDHLIDLKPDGTFRLNLDYFDYCTGLTMTNGRLMRCSGGRRESPSALDPTRDGSCGLNSSGYGGSVVRLTRSIAGIRVFRTFALLAEWH